MKTLLIIVSVLMCAGVVYAHDYNDDERSETYQKYDYGTDLNEPGSSANPYVTETTDRNGNVRTYETHQKVWTPPGQEHSPIAEPGSRLNPYVTERVR